MVATTKPSDAFARDAIAIPNPYTGKQIVCFREGSSTWAWVDDTNITLYSAAKARLLELGIDPTTWEYTVQGKVYDLPEPMVFSWEQHVSKSGRPYKDVTGINPVSAATTDRAAISALASAFDDAPALELVPRPESAAPAPDLLPEVAEAPLDELKRIAPLLGAANRAIDDLGAQARELEQAALDAVREANPVLFERLDAQTAKRDELTIKARKLLELHREASGETGRVLNGWYTITRSESADLQPIVNDAHLISWLLLDAPGLLRKVARIDYPALSDLILVKGDVLPAFSDMPVAVKRTTTYASRIEWSKLPTLVSEDTPAAPEGEAAANGHEESAGHSDPARFPSH